MKDLLHFSFATLKGRLCSSRRVHSQSRHRKNQKTRQKKPLGQDTREEDFPCWSPSHSTLCSSAETFPLHSSSKLFINDSFTLWSKRQINKNIYCTATANEAWRTWLETRLIKCEKQPTNPHTVYSFIYIYRNKSILTLIYRVIYNILITAEISAQKRSLSHLTAIYIYIFVYYIYIYIYIWTYTYNHIHKYSIIFIIFMKNN